MDQNFKQKLIEDFGLAGMDSAEQERMIEKIGNLLFESVVERSIDLMSDEVIDQFDEVVAHTGNDYQKVIVFLKEKVSGFDTVVSEEMSRLKRATSHIFA